jgi:hypothetical protein
MSTTKQQQIWIYEHSPIAPGEIKSVKSVNSDGWFITIDGELIDPHWCCPCTDWQEYNGGFALLDEQNTNCILETRDIKKYLVSVSDWVSEVAIASTLSLSMQQIRTWLKNNQDWLECREVRDGYEWRISPYENSSQNVTNGQQSENHSQKVNQWFTFNLDNAETLEDFEQLIRTNLLAFYTVGKALIEIRDRQLYIDLLDINTFEEYCQSPLTALRLGIKTKRRAYQLITAAHIVDVLKSEPMVHSPTSERQIRSLATLEPHEWKEAWHTAIDKSGDKPPTGAIVANVVQRIKERMRERLKMDNPYSKGDVLKFNSGGDSKTRIRNKRWAIVTAVHAFSCTVSDFEGEFVAHVNQLERLEVTLSEKQAAILLRDRLARIDTKHELAKLTVNYFARLEQFNLTEQEEAILDLLDAG